MVRPILGSTSIHHRLVCCIMGTMMMTKVIEVSSLSYILRRRLFINHKVSMNRIHSPRYVFVFSLLFFLCVCMLKLCKRIRSIEREIGEATLSNIHRKKSDRFLFVDTAFSLPSLPNWEIISLISSHHMTF
jgi:hypothetical protein